MTPEQIAKLTKDFTAEDIDAAARKKYEKSCGKSWGGWDALPDFAKENWRNHARMLLAKIRSEQE